MSLLMAFCSLYNLSNSNHHLIKLSSLCPIQASVLPISHLFQNTIGVCNIHHIPYIIFSKTITSIMTAHPSHIPSVIQDQGPCARTLVGFSAVCPTLSRCVILKTRTLCGVSIATFSGASNSFCGEIYIL